MPLAAKFPEKGYARHNWFQEILRPSHFHGGPMTTDVDIAKAAIAAGFSAVTTPTAVAIALAESGGNAGKSTAAGRGLWQIYVSEAGTDWADPNANARMAKAAYERSGFAYWPSYRTNRYLLSMPRATAAAAAATALNAGQDVVEAIPNPLAPVQELAQQARGAFNVVTDRDLWIRAGLFLLGSFLIVAATTALLLALTGKSLGQVVSVVLGSKTKAVKQIVKGEN